MLLFPGLGVLSYSCTVAVEKSQDGVARAFHRSDELGDCRACLSRACVRLGCTGTGKVRRNSS